MISIRAAVNVLIGLIISGLPEPFAKVARVILAIVAVMICIGFLLSLMGGPALFVP